MEKSQGTAAVVKKADFFSVSSYIPRLTRKYIQTEQHIPSLWNLKKML